MKSSIALVEDDVGLYGYAEPVVDIYESGTQKYASAVEIYDALRDMCETPEQGILMEMFSDVSEDSQKYHYTDRGSKLLELFPSGGIEWRNDVAVWRIDGGDIHDLVFQAVIDADMAKGVGLRKIVVDTLLDGIGLSARYKAFVEAWGSELEELNRFDCHAMGVACGKAFEKTGVYGASNAVMFGVGLYANKFCGAFYKRLAGMDMSKEMALIAECRALLYSYDDFILGLRHNQALYGHLEAQYKYKVEQLQADYDNRVKLLYAEAERQGVRLAITTDAKEITYIPEESL